MLETLHLPSWVRQVTLGVGLTLTVSEDVGFAAKPDVKADRKVSVQTRDAQDDLERIEDGILMSDQLSERPAK